MFVKVAISPTEGMVEVAEVIKVIERLLGGVRVIDKLISSLVPRQYKRL